MLRSRRLACARPRWQGVGGSALEGESAATLGRWRRRVGVGASSAARQRRFSRLALRWALYQGGVDGALAVAHWWRQGHSHGVGAGALVPEGGGPDNQQELEGGLGEWGVISTSWSWGGGVMVIIKLSIFNHE